MLRGPAPMPARDAMRVAAGALFGVAACGLAARMLAEGRASGLPLLVAPIGASAVLVFALPASPVAQPRAVILGNVVAALVGVACAAALPHPALAAAVAVGAAVLAMALLGCLHPPGGAIALGAALAAGSGAPLDYAYALVPVGLCSALLVAAGAAFGRVSGHAYPHRAPARVHPHGTRDIPPDERLGYRAEDLDRALAQYGELLDVSREDLDALFRQVEQAGRARLPSRILCADVMSRDLVSLDLRQTTESALLYLQRHDLRTAPVLDADGRVVGMARRAELLAARGRTVEAVLDPFVHKVTPATPIAALLPILSSGAAHEAMVVDPERRLVGIVTQTDLLAVLYRAHIVEAGIGAAA
ncbi:HPP family protein [Phenylobacterium sp.]|uniref:HPP family protein n=1 Tax=Phenylobacterium sp. TaxID=1871053 RepID=UPI0035B39D4C